ncbi:conserved hypothetical protein [Moraxellaceae bacterium 17A]|nr:conserved hypothetical protein [Moraxellaceae bacterium 17A]
MSKKRVECSDTFKAEAIAKVKENNGNISQTAKELGIPMNTLANWHKKAESGVLAGTQNYSPDIIALQEENRKLRKQLKIAQEEREILKKATAYFANEEG